MAEDILDMLDSMVDDFKYVIDKFLDGIEDEEFTVPKDVKDQLMSIRIKYFDD